jgi:smad nuclear-interacting protein 1
MSGSFSLREQRILEHQRSNAIEREDRDQSEKKLETQPYHRDRSSHDLPGERNGGSFNSYNEILQSEKKEILKEKPNFKPTGLLAKESNNIDGVQLKYTEPDDACLPPKEPEYLLFIFMPDSKVTRQYSLNGKSSHLIGRDEKVVDLLTTHETCSKQHAVIQFREIQEQDPESSRIVKHVKPYIIDLESSNGTFINDEEIPTSRFLELRREDIIKFGESDTDYVLMIS